MSVHRRSLARELIDVGGAGAPIHLGVMLQRVALAVHCPDQHRQNSCISRLSAALAVFMLRQHNKLHFYPNYITLLRTFSI